MFQNQSNGITRVFFQPWRPAFSDIGDQVKNQDRSSGCSELPPVGSYQELEESRVFKDIKASFLQDINDLQELAHRYVGNRYDKNIDGFYDHINNPHCYHFAGLLLIYRDTRPRIHQIVSILKDIYYTDDPMACGFVQTSSCENYIASVLHNCLNGIDLCLAGVHTRFCSSLIDLTAIKEGLPGKLYKIRKEQFHAFIQSFMIRQQREGIVPNLRVMEIHLFNSFYNFLCNDLALIPVEDSFAPSAQELNSEMMKEFATEAKLYVNECNIARRLSSIWAELLQTTLAEQGGLAWLTNPIDAIEITEDKVDLLNNRVFSLINFMLGAYEESSISLWTVIEQKHDSGTQYSLARYQEKIFAWIANYFCGSNVTVLSATSSQENSKRYIGSINQIYFWVFNSSESIHDGQVCEFDPDNHITLQLSHLVSVDLSVLFDNPTALYAILTQAVIQTDDAEDFSVFLMDLYTCDQLIQAPKIVVDIFFNKLIDKILCNKCRGFIERLVNCICDKLVCSKIKIEQLEILYYFSEIQLLELVLLELHQRVGDVTSLTRYLRADQVSHLSKESINKLLSAQDCRRLFKEAVYLGRAGVIANLLLTGHCDQLINLSNDKQQTPLIIFARRGNLAGLRYLLRLKNININQRDIYGLTPLLHAVTRNNRQCLEELVKIKNIAINDKVPKNGSTALIIAAQKGSWECISILIRVKGILVNEKNNDGYSALSGVFLGPSSDRWKCIRELIKADDIDVNEKNPDGYPVLFSAVEYDDWESIRELLESNKIKVNAREESQNGNRFTALHYAFRMSHLRCIQQLLNAKGIQVNIRDNDGCTPLHIAVRWARQPECVQVLLNSKNIQVNEEDDYGYTPLHYAVLSRCLSHVEVMLKSEYILVNERNSHGDTPLICAICTNQVELVRVLLKAKGIQVNESDHKGDTPLHRAAGKNRLECMQVLLKAKNIRINQKNHQGCTALHSAVLEGNLECVKVLINKENFRINERNYLGETALHCAVRGKYLKCIQELVNANGFFVSAVDNRGNTALHDAAKRGSWECIGELAKANNLLVNEKNHNGYTPLQLAIKKHHDRCVCELLKVSKIDVNAVCYHKGRMMTSLQLAVAYNSLKCLKLLLNDYRIDKRHLSEMV